MEKLTELYCDLFNSGVLMFDYRLPFSDAAIIEIDGCYGLFIDTSQITSIAEELVTIAHEAGHIFTGSTYKLASPYSVIQKHENTANKWAIKKLLPFDEMKRAMDNGLTTKYELADFFEVTEDFVQMAFDYYTGPCGLSFV